MIKHGCLSIICTQPLVCLSNYIVGKGMLRALRTHYLETDVIAVDYDPGASEVNQLNRIKLMLPTTIKRRKNSGKGPEVLELRGIGSEPEEDFGAEGLPLGACVCGSATGAASAYDSTVCGSSVGASSVDAEGESAHSCSGAGFGTEGFERAQPVSLGMSGIPPRQGMVLR